jgi:MFS family permease
VLVLGYRALLVFSPLLIRWVGRSAGGLCFLAAAGGAALWLVPDPSVHFVAAMVVGLGLSIGGYVLKASVSENASGASWNKIALNGGSLLAGFYVALMEPSWGLTGFLAPLVVLLALSGVLALWAVRGKGRGNVRGPAPRSGTAPVTGRQKLGWSLLGVAIGIKLFAVFAILPQYLLLRASGLPSWYGYLVSLNAVVIIALQRPIMNWITGRGTTVTRTRFVVVVLACCMVVLATPGYFHVDTLDGALLWILLCSVPSARPATWTCPPPGPAACSTRRPPPGWARACASRSAGSPGAWDPS